MTDKPKDTTQQALELLQEQGYVLWKSPVIGNQVKKIDMSQFSGNRFRVGVVSDTHLGSLNQQLTHLRAFYRLMKQRKIDTILHVGDVCEGEGLYRGQQYEIFVAGADGQTEYVVNNYPFYKGITTYVISGNHDSSFQVRAGVDVVANICRQRDDMVYLGFGGATIELAGIHWYLAHPDGGVSYARSYKQQKMIEQFPGGQKPRILLTGHYHITNILPNYRNVLGVMVGCFQSQTGYLKRKGLAPDVGGYIIDLVVSDGSVISIKTEWIPFYKVIENDF